MNNSLLEIEEDKKSEDIKPLIRKKQSELLKIIETLEAVASSKEWKLLDEYIFSKQVDSIKKRLETESTKNELQPAEIYRLNGQLLWAKRYSNLYKLAEVYKAELNNLTQKLNENVITI